MGYAQPPPEYIRAFRWWQLKQVLRAVAVLTVTSAIVFAFFATLTSRTIAILDDTQNSQPRETTATVKASFTVMAGRNATPYFTVVLTSPAFQQQEVHTNSGFAIGQQVRSHYLVGRNGQVYVTRVEPIKP